MTERDYPVGHPAASDYNGEPWKNPAAIFDQDYPLGHPARLGANVRPIDTPDGQRAAQLAQAQNLSELAMLGSLPALIDPRTKEPLPIAPDQLAHVYAIRNGLKSPLADEITQRYGLTPQAVKADAAAVPQPTAEEQAAAYIQSLGYLPEHAAAIIAKWGVPDVAASKLKDEHK